MTGGCVVLGAGGRVGRLLRGSLGAANDGTPVWFQSRRPGQGIDIAAPFAPDLANRLPHSVGLLLVLSGCTRGSPQALAANTDFALQGLELARVIGCRRVVLCSSAAVYGRVPGQLRFRESDQADPEHPYGRAKLAMEQAARDWHRAASAPPEVTCLRMANVAGADMLADAVRQSAGQPLKLDRFADARSPRRSYLSPATLLRVVTELARRPAGQGFRVLNLADPGPPLEMAAILSALGAAGVPVTWGVGSRRRPRPLQKSRWRFRNCKRCCPNAPRCTA